MTDLERMKLSVELLRVKAAKAELEYKIAEKSQEINNIKEHILIQDQKINDLEGRLNNE